MTAIEARHAEVLPTNPETTFQNAGKPGINRLALIDNWLLINNIGRNHELWQMQPPSHRLMLRGTTIFPGQDIPSQLDIDLHAAFSTKDRRFLLATDHYGL